MSVMNPTSGNDTGLSAKTPHDRLMAAIGILQAHYLASDTALVADKIFGNSYFDTTGLEHAINMLIDLLPVVEDAHP